MDSQHPDSQRTAGPVRAHNATTMVIECCLYLQVFSPKLESGPKHCQQEACSSQRSSRQSWTNMTNSRMRVRGGRLETDDDIEFFHFGSLIFPVFCGCSRAQNLQAPKWPWTASKAFKLHANRKDNYGRNGSQALHVPKGMCVEVLACATDPMQVFPAGRR